MIIIGVVVCTAALIFFTIKMFRKQAHSRLVCAQTAILLDRFDALDLDLSQRQRTAGPGNSPRDPHDPVDPNPHLFKRLCNLLNIRFLTFLYFGYEIHLPKDTKLRAYRPALPPHLPHSLPVSAPARSAYPISPSRWPPDSAPTAKQLHPQQKE